MFFFLLDSLQYFVRKYQCLCFRNHLLQVTGWACDRSREILF